MLNERLKRFGSLLVDPDAVLAVSPIFYADDQHVRGYRVVLCGGTADIFDPATIALIEQQFGDES